MREGARGNEKKRKMRQGRGGRSRGGREKGEGREMGKKVFKIRGLLIKESWNLLESETKLLSWTARAWTPPPATTTTINKSNYNKQPITVGPVFMERKQARK